jgi:GNAT superfamily N-acetyltransferase
MSSVEIRKVADKKSLEAFIQFHYDLYRDNPYDAPTLHSDEVHTLSKDKNAAFEFCEADYFLAYRDGKVVGRIAGIINRRANERWNTKSVRFGWVDFIDDMEVSRALFNAVEEWGRSKGMTQMVGPLGFTDLDPEGMLIEGFDQLGTMSTIYNYDYYPRHMEQLGGFTKDNDYVEYKLIVPKDGMPEKYQKIAQMVMKRYNLHPVHPKRSQIFGKEQIGRKVLDVINKSYQNIYGFSEMTEGQIDEYLRMYFPMLDTEMICLIEDRNTPNHDIIGVGISITNMTRALQKCKNGRLWPFGWWHCLKAMKFHQAECLDLLLIGFLPEYQKKGANALLFYDLIPRYQKYGFKWGETNVEMETNENVQSQWQYLEHEQHKRRRCYKKSI